MRFVRKQIFLCIPFSLRPGLPGEMPQFGLHFSMFMPTIEAQGDDEQKEYWMPRCMSLAVLGTYAQTEMGHG